MSQDEDLAREFLDREERHETQEGEAVDGSTVRMSEFSPEVASLAVVQDYLQQLIHVQVRRGGSNPGAFRSADRPVTKVQQLRSERRVQGIRALDALLLGE